jgi:uncharacterized protein YbjT (DUF2867 family)
VDADDIADVAVAALTDDRHVGELYELTGPRLLTFAEAVLEISRAVGREIRYVPISVGDFAAAAAEQGVPSEVIEMLTFIFGRTIPGHDRTPAPRASGISVHADATVAFAQEPSSQRRRITA